jgi:hypothetical protein
MKSALIDIPSSLVVQVEPLGQTFEVDSDHEWVDCPDNITAGNFTYVNGSFNPYAPVPSFTAEENKQIAVALLQATDWATIPDVADPAKSNPYLSNAQKFVAYRNVVRQYAINPVAGVISWPGQIKAKWVNV